MATPPRCPARSAGAQLWAARISSDNERLLENFIAGFHRVQPGRAARRLDSGKNVPTTAQRATPGERLPRDDGRHGVSRRSPARWPRHRAATASPETSSLSDSVRNWRIWQAGASPPRRGATDLPGPTATVISRMFIKTNAAHSRLKPPGPSTAAIGSATCHDHVGNDRRGDDAEVVLPSGVMLCRRRFRSRLPGLLFHHDTSCVMMQSPDMVPFITRRMAVVIGRNHAVVESPPSPPWCRGARDPLTSGSPC